MFTGIIESLGQITHIEKDKTNITFTVQSSISQELKIDQSLAHDGVCLTVIATRHNTHQVTAIAETLSKTNLSSWQIGKFVNLERCTQLGHRLDGHIVQGHVDTIGKVVEINDLNGSWYFKIKYTPSSSQYITVEKGSISINGTSLTVVESGHDFFSVAIIPYTYTHTTFQYLQVGDSVNLEFDILGKYVAKLIENRKLPSFQ